MGVNRQWAWTTGSGRGQQAVGVDNRQWAWTTGNGRGQQVVGVDNRQWAWTTGNGRGQQVVSMGHQAMDGANRRDERIYQYIISWFKACTRGLRINENCMAKALMKQSCN